MYDEFSDIIDFLKDEKTYTRKQIDFALECYDKGGNSSEKDHSTREELSQEAIEILRQHFTKLMSMTDKEIAETQEQLIPDTFMEVLRKYKTPMFKSKLVNTEDLHRDQSSAPFFLTDVVSPSPDGSIALNMPFPYLGLSICRPALWSDFLEVWMKWNLIVKHKGQFGTSATKVISEFFGDRLSHLNKSSWHKISSLGKGFANRWWKRTKEKFSPLKDSTEFYTGSEAAYGDSEYKDDCVFVFSTTSGLLIPEEYYGSYLAKKLSWARDKSAAKNPSRKDYFKAGILSSSRTIPVYYMWDKDNTINVLKNSYKSAPDEFAKQAYRTEAESILAKALMINNLEIIEGDFKKVNKWYIDPKAYLTLTCKRYAIWSFRQPYGRTAPHIGHGLVIDADTFSIVLRDILKTTGIINLIMRNWLIGTVLTTASLLVPEKFVSEPIANTLRQMQFHVARQLYETSNAGTIKGRKALKRKEASRFSKELIRSYLF